MIVNQATSFGRLSLPKLRNTIKVLKNLGSRASERKKAWFIEIDKIFQEKNLKIFYLPLSTLHKLISAKTYAKLPDPVEFLVGLSFVLPGRDSRSDMYQAEDSVVQTRKTSTSRNKAPLRLDTSNRSPFNLTGKRKSIGLNFGTPQVIQPKQCQTWVYKK